jgi:intracellular multiplication protein IcmE
MTNNFGDNGHDDANDEFHEHELGMEDPKKIGMRGNLAEAWRTRPLFKLMVMIIALFAVCVAAFSFFGGAGSDSEFARLGRAPNLHEAPGGHTSPYMRAETNKANDERAKEALANGGSAIPTPIGQASDINPYGDQAKKDDELNVLKLELEKIKAQQQAEQVQTQQIKQQVQQPQTQQPKQAEQFDNSLAEAMQNQMKQMLDSWKSPHMTSVEVTKAADLKAEQDKDAAAAQASATANTSSTQTPPQIIVNAGTVSYAQLLTEANSDVPGPIMAQIVSGPLTGARAIGGFQVSNGYEKYLVLKFSIADRKGKDYSINAIALDPSTTLGGMATEVDERYFVRVVLPAAAGFLQGLGQSLGQGNTSVVSDGTTTIATQTSAGFRTGMYTGLGDAAGTMGQFFQQQANVTKPLVRVAAGTPMGLFFVSSVVEPTSQGSAPVPQQQVQGNGGIPVSQGIGMSPYGNATPVGMQAISGYGATPASSSGVPYPNYATSGSSYNSMPMMNRGYGSMGTGGMMPGQGYGQ